MKTKISAFFLILCVVVLSLPAAGPALPPGLYARLDTPRGAVVIRLEYEKVPLTVANFVGLAEGTISNRARPMGKPFFDGLTFHRVEPGFVIQGGDPQGNGMGNPGYQFPDEFHPTLKHSQAGILSMANSGPDTNGCQFFITLAPTPHLDGRHAVFGKVVQGMAAVFNIRRGDAITKVTILRIGEKAKKYKVDHPLFKRLVESVLQKREAVKRQQQSAELQKIKARWPKAVVTPSGLRYVVLKKGVGAKPAKGAVLTVHYTGTLLDGKKFDSSRDRNEPFTFPVGLGRVIKGWDEGLADMCKGEKRILIIPPQLGYGERGAGNGEIPGNAWLVFDVELLGFTNK